MNTLNKKHITYAGISDILHKPGTLQVRIHRLNGYFVPFIFHAAPGAAQVGQGPIAEEGSLVASHNLEDLIEGLKDTLGDVEILIPDPIPAPGVLH